LALDTATNAAAVVVEVVRTKLESVADLIVPKLEKDICQREDNLTI
jgi:hypothetical protein